ncbi:hypothetical protein KRR39_20355 [Nocardioides panacis]|uniref:Uncharacterized protein n=1 Tax=Nocardioides panacis TaxID=2849501 RepID=A0A975XZR9_9ACTN|nr:hypothetical protein [Nocardioides panacis]QWZ07717.1 hypothetical protein KRR39_20355 [Nocardioides panacis]
MTEVLAKDFRLTPRPSHKKVSPEGDFYYWCLTCNYCQPGQAALCPRDKREYDRKRKAIEREAARLDMRVDKIVLRRVHDRADRTYRARSELIEAINAKAPFEDQQRALLTFTRHLLKVIEDLPKPRP